MSPLTAPAAPVLDRWQQDALSRATEPLLVLGGPGSGKTTLLAQLATRALASSAGQPPLVLTFSRRSASELRNRIARSLGATVSPPQVMTVHSLARSLLRRFGPPGDSEPRVLTAPEQEFRVRELLLGAGPAVWPEDLAAAHGTRVFARQVRACLARARQLGLDPEDLVAAGRAAKRPEWVALGHFFDGYLDVLDHEGSLDYAELVHRARILLAGRGQAAALPLVGPVLVDEYGELDPAQIGLLRQLVPPGGTIVAAGDPDQVVFRFRGAHPRGLAEFADTFRTADDRPAATVTLGGSHRLPEPVAAALRQFVRRIPLTVGGEAGVGLRPSPLTEPAVEVLICATESDQAALIADTVRAARLDDGVSYGAMAVIVRSGRRQLASIARALVSAGVPVEVAGDEIPLSSELAVRPLLLALEVVLRRGAGDADEARRLLCSPLGGFDAVAFRRLARTLHRAERDEIGIGNPVPTGAELVAAALAGGGRLPEGATGPEVDRLRSFSAALSGAGEVLTTQGNGVAEALWSLWTATDWPQRLRADSAAGGAAGRLADRALDAVGALMEAAGASAQPPGPVGVRGFLAEVAAQEIPADTERESEVHGRGVRLLTAHRAKGGEWELVVVAGVQEGIWPDPGRSGEILIPEELVSAGLTEPLDRRSSLADERRLFLLACSRSRGRLLVTAVAGSDGEANQPSRFLTELGVEPRIHRPGQPRPLTLAALTADLRRHATDDTVSPALRRAAVVRLAALAALTDSSGRSVVPQADPDRWWGVLPPSGSDRVESSPLRLSATQLTGLLTCPRQYLLSRRAHADPTRSAAAGLGSVIHVLAEHARTDGLTAAQLQSELDVVWDRIPFDATWMSASERTEAELALTRFVSWQEANAHAEVIGVELPFEFSLTTEHGPVLLSGTVDRLERTADGRLRVIDFKTGRRTPTQPEAAVHEQLGLYQLAIDSGAFAQLAAGESAGGVLVYLRRADTVDGYPKQFHQASLSERPHPEDDPVAKEYPTWIHQRIARAVDVLADGCYPATPGEGCRWCPFTASCPSQPAGRQVVS